MAAEYPWATWVPSPNFWQGREGHDILAIVYHTEAGHEAGTDAEFQNPNSQVSAHFSVALDGTVRQFVSLANSAWHAGGNWPDGTNANLLTIGVEREDGGDPTTPMSDAQEAAWGQLMGWLCDRFGIPRKIVGNGQEGLISHHLINPAHAGCAGPAVEAVAQAFAEEDDVTTQEKLAYVRLAYLAALGREPESSQVQEQQASKIADDGSNLDAVIAGIADSPEGQDYRAAVRKAAGLS